MARIVKLRIIFERSTLNRTYLVICTSLLNVMRTELPFEGMVLKSNVCILNTLNTELLHFFSTCHFRQNMNARVRVCVCVSETF
jgi:hypothetical protein